MLEKHIEQDLKAALLSGDKTTVTTLRGLKSVLLYAKVAEGKREEGLTDEAVIALLSKEAKKRQESADLYVQGGSQERADAELTEKALIETYLPAQMDEAELSKIIDSVISQTGTTAIAGMGPVIAAVRAKTGSSADGSTIARLVKERLS